MRVLDSEVLCKTQSHPSTHSHSFSHYTASSLWSQAARGGRGEKQGGRRGVRGQQYPEENVHKAVVMNIHL